MLRIAIVAGSTRLNRVGTVIAAWVNGFAGKRTDAEFELVDVPDIGLPSPGGELAPPGGQYASQHATDWAAKVASFDAFIFVTPQDDHPVPADLKHALDFARAEWVDKAAGFVQATVALRQASADTASSGTVRPDREQAGAERR